MDLKARKAKKTMGSGQRRESLRFPTLQPVKPGSPLTPQEFNEQLSCTAAALAEALSRSDLTSFYAALRATELPFLCAQPELKGLAGACAAILHRLGGISPAVGLAVENHLYVTCALATFPKGTTAQELKRREILDLVGGERLLVANSNSKVHADRLGAIGTLARREGEDLRVEGTAAYTSLSTQADLLFLLTVIEGEGPALLVMPLRGNPAIEIGPFLFPRAMLDSDTRRVTFHSPLVPAGSTLYVGQDELMSQLLTFQLTWHQTLLAALYLGAAARAIEEGRLFLRSVQGPAQKPLAELDGMLADMGRLAIRYRSARSLCNAAVAAIDASIGTALSPVALTEAFDQACAAKHAGGRCAEEVVTRVRRIIGARSFIGDHPLERLSQEVVFGPLGGEVDASIERRIGRRVLSDTSFLDLGW